MLYNIKPLHLHCVFHGIRFKVNKGWVSGIDTLLFLYTFCINNNLHSANLYTGSHCPLTPKTITSYHKQN